MRIFDCHGYISPYKSIILKISHNIIKEQPNGPPDRREYGNDNSQDTVYPK